MVKYIRGIGIEKKEGEFVVTDYLNYKNSIFGLKIPLTYEEVVKNPNFLKDINNKQPVDNKKVVEVNEFKVKGDRGENKESKAGSVEAKQARKNSTSPSMNPPQPKKDSP